MNTYCVLKFSCTERTWFITEFFRLSNRAGNERTLRIHVFSRHDKNVMEVFSDMIPVVFFCKIACKIHDLLLGRSTCRVI